MGKFKATKSLLSLSFNLIKNKKRLNDDFENNYNLCKIASEKAVKSSKINFLTYGIDNIPKDGPTLLVSNHRSFFDIFALVNAIDRPMSFAAAVELMKYPVLKDYISSIECVLIDRNTTDIKKMKEQLLDMEKTIIKNGLILFPEGECSYESDELKPFKKGGFMAATKNNVPIVPTYINYDILSKIGKWMVPTNETTIIFGDSFKPKDLLGEKTNPQEVANYSRKKILELKHNINSSKN